MSRAIGPRPRTLSTSDSKSFWAISLTAQTTLLFAEEPHATLRCLLIAERAGETAANCGRTADADWARRRLALQVGTAEAALVVASILPGSYE